MLECKKKITSKYGTKSIITEILPDVEIPIIEKDTRLEMLYNIDDTTKLTSEVIRLLQEDTKAIK